jgi:predicted metal-dependent hydrolase
MSEAGDYDARYLAGVVLFNRGDYFEAHEVWEDLWADSANPDRRFYQGLLQAAVGLLHFCNGNLRGAVKLYRSGLDYLAAFGRQHRGLDLDDFRGQMQRCFAELLAHDEPPPGLAPDEERLPVLRLDPEPAAWPDPADYLKDDA